MEESATNFWYSDCRDATPLEGVNLYLLLPLISFAMQNHLFLLSIQVFSSRTSSDYNFYISDYFGDSMNFSGSIRNGSRSFLRDSYSQISSWFSNQAQDPNGYTTWAFAVLMIRTVGHI